MRSSHPSNICATLGHVVSVVDLDIDSARAVADLPRPAFAAQTGAPEPDVFAETPKNVGDGDTDSTHQSSVDERVAALATLADAAERAQQYAGNSKAAATIKAYAIGWRDFLQFCERRGAEPLPASDATVAGYLAELADAGLKAATIARRLVVISQAHKAADVPSPTTASLVRRTHAGIRRSIGTAQTAKAPAVVDDLRRMLGALPGTRVGLRDHAPAAARLRRRLPPLRAGRPGRRRSRILERWPGRHLEKIQDRPGGAFAAHRHPVRLLGQDVSRAVAAGLARDGAHR